MQNNFVKLIEGDVSALEFQQRVSDIYRGIQQNIPEVQAFYADNFGINLDEQSIFLGALDPTVGEDIVSGRITPAQIGGEAKRAGFEITTSEAKRLQEAGLTQEEARRLFSVAEAQLPRLQELQAQRGIAQEQQIGLEQLSEALVFQSQEEMEIIARLEEQEASEFAPTTGATRTGRRVTGLTEL